MCRRAGRQLIARIHALSISAVRPIPLKLITISKNNSKGAEVMANEWAAKIQRFVLTFNLQRCVRNDVQPCNYAGTPN